ncbi:sorbosone dehydrogenase family protein [Glaciecola sp. XM2]|uniref:PQQ-dependent sugar dehydrogenase n=1 Tax=Glaciecola sp. XM2 TaxID=1914931 RepID=UPI001BDF09B7|nr:PQQ-dependent sugar dehydrogenase [Glaciecola sp. XM2]MBT1451232.1 sorbosone dehydrogenase family protein [Glaciecola sp. XM2]
MTFIQQSRNLFVSIAVLTTLGCAQTPDIEVSQSTNAYTTSLVTNGIAIPWGMTWLNETDLLVSDKLGSLRIVRNGKLLEEPISGLPAISINGQGGLLDVEVDPNYAQNGWIYFAYSGFEGESEGFNTSVMRAQLENMALVNQQVIFDGEPNSDKRQHFGSRLSFDNEGYLYITIGDRGERDIHPQRLDRDAGKVHRIYPDGSIPSTNPFVDNADANNSIYSYGHRNPQGMAVHPVTGKIWTHEHGPRGGDEINLLQAGANYGWPIITFGRNYIGTEITDKTEMEGMMQPQWQWTPSIAPSGMLFVTSDRYPQWQGKMLVGSLKFGYLLLMEMDGEQVVSQSIALEDVGRLRSISQGPDGYIYVGTDGTGIFKIVPRDAG